jgi:hypothetical protein
MSEAWLGNRVAAMGAMRSVDVIVSPKGRQTMTTHCPVDEDACPREVSLPLHA